MVHFVRNRNLPFSIEEIKRMIANCTVCNELKPKFQTGIKSHLIKATQPFERLSMDFKGPLPSSTRNHYILTIIDEYSRFPFAFACSDMTSQTVIRCLCQLFSLFGVPSYIHTDRGASFMSAEVQQFLLERGVASSRTTPYNPQGNGQVERLNGTLWKSIQLALKSRELPVENWEDVLLDSLHSIRTLLCTATNETPHERVFRFNRKSASGTTLPIWLTSSRKVYLKRNVRVSKYDPLVDEVELMHCNPYYAHVRFPDGREDTVSIRQLAPKDIAPDVQLRQHGDNSESIEQSLSPSTDPNTCDTDPSCSEPYTDQSVDSHTIDNLETHLHKQQRVHPYQLRNRDA